MIAGLSEVGLAIGTAASAAWGTGRNLARMTFQLNTREKRNEQPMGLTTGRLLAIGMCPVARHVGGQAPNRSRAP